MTKQVAAKPQGFMLKMRLVAPDGTPFFQKWYRVKWGEKLIPPQSKPPMQTDSNGAVSVLLDAGRSAPPQGMLYVLERSTQNERVVWSIPLNIVEDPVPIALPKLDDFPVPPPQGASQERMEQHRQEVVDFIGRFVLPINEVPPVLEVPMRALRDIVATSPAGQEQHGTDDALWKAWEAFCVVFTLALHGYEAAWRLWNLGDLPLIEEPTFALLASDYEMLLRALDRFAYRHGLTSPLPRPATPDMVKACLDKIREVHDQRGIVSP